LSNSFSYASYGNSIIAIIAGLLANHVTNAGELRPFHSSASGKYNKSDIFSTAGHAKGSDTTGSEVRGGLYRGGFVNPFDVAFVALLLCGLAAAILWEENYGETKSSAVEEDSSSAKDGRARRSNTILAKWKRALNTTVSDPEVLLCGIVSSLFEGSMYVFVFMWTPALTKLTPGLESSAGNRLLAGSSSDATSTSSLPFGLIFSTFMVCCMAGSSTFSLAMEKSIPLENLAVLIFAVASSTMAVVAISSSDTVTFVAMNIFEMTVGMYFPTMGTLKSSIVPESSRAAIYNLYRIPLNFIVLTSLLTNLSVTSSFVACSLMLGTATVLQYQLRRLRVASAMAKLRPESPITDLEGTTEIESAKSLQMS